MPGTVTLASKQCLAVEDRYRHFSHMEALYRYRSAFKTLKFFGKKIAGSSLRLLLTYFLCSYTRAWILLEHKAVDAILDPSGIWRKGEFICLASALRAPLAYLGWWLEIIT
jgi:hypothetical protein